MAEGDTNLTNLVLSGDLTVGDDADVVGDLTAGTISSDAGVSATTTVTAGTGITSTTGNITATAGAVSAGTTLSAGTSATVGTTLTVGTNTSAVGTVASYCLSLYDVGTNVSRLVYLLNGTLTVV